MNMKELLLTQLAEELGEVQKEIFKALRFGLNGINPSTRESNADAICRELTDVIAVLDKLSESCGILLQPNDKTSDNYICKRERIIEYLEYSKERGILK